MNINFLLTVDGSSASGLVNLNPVNERIEHGVRQFLAVPVFLDQSDKSGSVRLFDFVLLSQTFQFLNAIFEQNLFFIVLLDHPLCLPLRQQTIQGTFIELLNYAVQISHSLSGFGKLLLTAVR